MVLANPIYVGSELHCSHDFSDSDITAERYTTPCVMLAVTNCCHAGCHKRYTIPCVMLAVTRCRVLSRFLLRRTQEVFFFFLSGWRVYFLGWTPLRDHPPPKPPFQWPHQTKKGTILLLLNSASICILIKT